MKKLFRSVVLAATLAMPVTGLVVTLPGCAAVQGIFQSDPVGASLKTLKDTYEASVKTAGRLYVAKQISETQIRRFRDEANKFYTAYTELSTIHDIAGIKEGDVRIEQLGALLDVLVNMVAVFSAQGAN